MSVAAIEVLVVVAIILVTILLWRKKPRNMPPGPRGWPIVGSLLSLSQDEPYIEMEELGKKYGGRGKILSLQLGTSTMVILNSYEAIKEAFVTKGDCFSSRPESPFFTSILDGKGVASAKYSRQWREQKTFALKTLRKFGMGKRSLEDKISEEISFFFDEIDKFNGKPFDVEYIVDAALANLICSILIGERYDYEDPPFKHLLQQMNIINECTTNAGIVEYFQILQYIPFLNGGVNLAISIATSIVDFFVPIIEKHKQEFQEDDPRDYIDAYLIEIERTKHVHGSSFQDKRILPSLIFELFWAGYKTASTTFYWIILYLVVYPDIQKQIQQELDRVVGRDRLPTLEDESELPFIHAVIREVQRIATVVPLALPHCTTKDAQLMGYDIPQNTQIFPNLWAVHNDPSIWEEPRAFNPSRFIDAGGNLVKPNHYLPFSSGKRECPGEQFATMQLYLFTASLLHRYSVKLPEGAPTPSLKGKIAVTFIASPYEVIFKKR